MPMRARVPMVKHDEVIGSVFLIPPISRRSCSFAKLWMIEPEQRNRRALKNACVEMWRKASCGKLSPIDTIIRPN